MSKINIIYYSFTGNTMRMVNAFEKGLEESGADYKISKISEMNKDDFFSGDILIMASPAHGSEEIHKDYFQPFMNENKDKFINKKILLFGSYGWGGGKYLQDWKNRLENLGAVIISEPLSCSGSPNAEMKEILKNMGKKIGNL